MYDQFSTAASPTPIAAADGGDDVEADTGAVVLPFRTDDQPSVTAAQRRRHLAVYHRALRGARTPEQRAAVAARYRQLFVVTAAS